MSVKKVSVKQKLSWALGSGSHIRWAGWVRAGRLPGALPDPEHDGGRAEVGVTRLVSQKLYIWVHLQM